MLIHIWLCGQGVIKHFSPGRFREIKLLFFGLKYLNKPCCKVKNQLTFCKVNYFKYYFYDTAYSQCFKISYGLTTIFPHTYLKKREQTEKDFEFSMLNLNDFYWNSKVLSCSWLKIYFSSFYWSYSLCCFDVAQRRVNQRWKWKRCFDVAWRCSNQHWNNVEMFAG